MDAEGAVDAGAVEAEDGAEGDGGPLGVFHATVAALVVAGDGFDHGLVTGGHLNHVGSLLLCVWWGGLGVCGCFKLCLVSFAGLAVGRKK